MSVGPSLSPELEAMHQDVIEQEIREGTRLEDVEEQIVTMAGDRPILTRLVSSFDEAIQEHEAKVLEMRRLRARAAGFLSRAPRGG